MSAEPGWCGVCGLPVPAGERFCRWPFGARAGDRQHEDEVVPWASHSLAFMTELVELQHWRCPRCGDYLPDSPRGTAIDHIIPRVYGGPHRRWNLQLLHPECNSAKGKKITAEGDLENRPRGVAERRPPARAAVQPLHRRTEMIRLPGCMSVARGIVPGLPGHLQPVMRPQAPSPSRRPVGDPDTGAVRSDHLRVIEALAAAGQGRRPPAVARVQFRYRGSASVGKPAGGRPRWVTFSHVCVRLGVRVALDFSTVRGGGRVKVSADGRGVVSQAGTARFRSWPLRRCWSACERRSSRQGAPTIRRRDCHKVHSGSRRYPAGSDHS